MGADRLNSPLPRTVRGLSIVSGLNDAASEMVYPLLPALVTITLGGSAATLGALDGASDLAASLLRILSGRLADEPRRRRPLLLVGYGLAVLARPLIALARQAGVVVALRVVDRVGKGIRSPARDAMLAEAVPPGLRGRAFGYHRAWDHAGAVIGGLLGFTLLELGLTVTEVIAWSAVPGAVTLLMLVATLRGERMPPVAPPVAAVAAPTAPRRFWAPVLALTLLLVTRMPEALLLLHLERSGVAIAWLPLAWAALNLVRSAAAWPAGRLVDRLGERRVVMWSGIAGAVGALGFAAAEGIPALILTFLLVGMVTGISEPAEKTLVARLAPKGSGSAFGQAQSVLGFAALGAGLLFGMAVDQYGGAVALAWSAGAGIVATLLWLAVAPLTAPVTR